MTEHRRMNDYPRIRDALRRVRGRDSPLALDDTGAEFAGSANMGELGPDIIKVDFEITRGIDIDLIRRSLTAVVVGPSAKTGARIVAEGVETVGEFDAVCAPWASDTGRVTTWAARSGLAAGCKVGHDAVVGERSGDDLARTSLGPGLFRQLNAMYRIGV